MKYLLLLLVFSGCSHYKKQPALSDSAELNAIKAPAWLYSPYEICTQTKELCATGEGQSLAQADAEARANLASVFEIKIQSDLNINTISSLRFSWQAEVREEVQESIKQSVEQILETVQIKEHFIKDGLYHSLASIDREKASELIENRIRKADIELKALWNNQQRTNLRRIVKLFLERERLNERYSILSTHSIPPEISWQKIIEWRESRPKVEALHLKVGQAPDWMKEKIAQLLTEAGFELVRGDANKFVTVQLDSIIEFMKVDGFEKYTFTLGISSFVNGGKLGSISVSESVVGRTQADALLKVKKFFNDHIEHHLADLRLD